MVKRRSIQIPPGHLAANIIPLVRNNVTHGKKNSDVFVTLSDYQLKICNIVNILVYRSGLQGEDQAVHQLHRGRAACPRQHVFQSYKSQTGFEGIHLRGGSGV